MRPLMTALNCFTKITSNLNRSYGITDIFFNSGYIVDFNGFLYGCVSDVKELGQSGRSSEISVQFIIT